VLRVHVELYARWMEEERHLARATIGRRLSTIVGVYRFAVIDGFMTESPAEHVRRPKIDTESTTLGLDRMELGAFLAQAAAAGPVDHALACLLGLLGLRVSEACRIDIENLGSERGTVASPSWERGPSALKVRGCRPPGAGRDGRPGGGGRRCELSTAGAGVCRTVVRFVHLRDAPHADGPAARRPLPPPASSSARRGEPRLYFSRRRSWPMNPGECCSPPGKTLEGEEDGPSSAART
jgi:hypothetical protein